MKILFSGRETPKDGSKLFTDKCVRVSKLDSFLAPGCFTHHSLHSTYSLSYKTSITEVEAQRKPRGVASITLPKAPLEIGLRSSKSSMLGRSVFVEKSVDGGCIDIADDDDLVDADDVIVLLNSFNAVR